jgi:MoaA/NifB/PqqE/SkfB family radical SAM enzyme
VRKFQAFLDLHSSCNYRCGYCFRSIVPGGQVQQGPLPLDVLDSITPLLNSVCWSLSLSCAGEPLLHPQFQEIIDRINCTCGGLDVSLVTNGYEQTPAKQDILAGSIVSRIFVSVDTLQPALYGRLCGCSPDALQRVRGNIESLAKKRKKGGPPYLFITAILMKSTLPSLPELAEWVCKSGVDGLKIQWLIPLSERAKEEVVMYDETTRHTILEIENILAPRGIYLDYPFIPIVKKLKSIVRGAAFIKNKTEYFLFSYNKFMKSRRIKGCRIAGTHLNILQDGSVYLCPNNAGPAISTRSLAPAEQKALVQKAAASLSDDVSFAECESCRFSMTSFHAEF